MGLSKLFQRVSQAPTNPHPQSVPKKFDVADLYRGPVSEIEQDALHTVPLDEKLRQAYFWIINNAIISPHYDIEYNEGPNQSFVFGDSKTRVNLPSGQSYSSFILMPLLNFAVRRRCLLIGGPGRGKTASSVLMGVLAGYPLKQVRQAMIHGQPQMTISDLIGSPLPADLVHAQKMEDIRIAWRQWLGMRVKIVDEYNRIPTRTQSALLTVMGDNYTELLNHIYECPEAAWYLTANYEGGGGTYQVIEALRDRIDIVVMALHFNTRFLNDLLVRIETDVHPEEVVPAEIIFSEDEQDRVHQEILSIVLPKGLRRRIEFFSSQFEFCEPAAEQFEYKTKDTAKASGQEVSQMFAQETGKDPLKDLGNQTDNGFSVRTLMTLMVFAKALAYFHGSAEVSLEDLRQIMPFVLHEKMSQDPDAPFFNVAGNEVFRSDRISWIRRLFDLSCAEYDRLNLDHEDPVADFELEFDGGLEGVSASEVRARLTRIERVLTDWSKGRKLYGNLFDDILKLKYLHQRYTNYLRWLEWEK